ncbi:hypothetical protein [Massilia soli]|uniref:Transcriptional regulator n=1 Tax=Massilia soli TaxID=2792854 RepID=A0ABS7SU59_9BURK|nr:hypothetical protein [Massilia soli]MBZ2209497.1 hypothetical protein [Massilia soli]
MAIQMIRIFDQYADAEAARDALLAAGYARDAVRVSVRDDEAGPVQGNFTVDNGTEAARGTAARNDERVTQRGLCMVVLDAAEGREAAAAAELLERFGGRDIDKLAPPANHQDIV